MSAGAGVAGRFAERLTFDEAAGTVGHPAAELIRRASSRQVADDLERSVPASCPEVAIGFRGRRATSTVGTRDDGRHPGCRIGQ
jgi:hypothetical protein